MSIYDFNVRCMDGQEQSISAYKNKVMLIVNTASHCGLAPQLEGLERLHEAYKDKGLVVLGFPCDQFANQEEADDEAVIGICKKNYGVTFTMFSKIDVNGKNTDPLFRYLKKQKRGFFGSAIKWNFTKFLVDKDGKVVKRFAPTETPERIEEQIVSLLEK